jgi:hypothetical protein
MNELLLVRTSHGLKPKFSCQVNWDTRQGTWDSSIDSTLEGVILAMRDSCIEPNFNPHDHEKRFPVFVFGKIRQNFRLRNTLLDI